MDGIDLRYTKYSIISLVVFTNQGFKFISNLHQTALNFKVLAIGMGQYLIKQFSYLSSTANMDCWSITTRNFFDTTRIRINLPCYVNTPEDNAFLGFISNVLNALAGYTCPSIVLVNNHLCQSKDNNNMAYQDGGILD